MTQHHPFGASSLGRRKLCPASYHAEAGLEELHSEEAESGTRCHQAIAAILQNAAPPCELNPAEYDLVEMAWIWAERALAEFVADSEKDHYKTRIEATGSYRLNGEEIPTTADWILTDSCDHHGMMVDWKFGWGEPAEDEVAAQAAGLALMAFDCIRELDKVDVKFRFVARGVTLEESYRREQAEELRRAIQRIRESAEQPGAVFHAGDHCRKCRALPSCPEAAAAANRALDVIAPPGNFPDKSEVKERVFHLSDAAFLELFDRRKLLEAITEALQVRAVKMLENDPRSVPGYELRRIGGSRTAEDIEALWGAVKDVVRPEDFRRGLKVSVAEVEKLYTGQRANDGVKLKDARREFEGRTAGIVSQGTRQTIRRITER